MPLLPLQVNAIDKLLSAFIIPLQSDDISTTDAKGQSRVHCSLNINTETGRLSARRPNLQNQPALEKDRYKVSPGLCLLAHVVSLFSEPKKYIIWSPLSQVRQAFTSDTSEGKTLIVADYGQLELRILAHMAACESMIRAFVLGGDFHSRTAFGMYDYIQEAVRKGQRTRGEPWHAASFQILVVNLYIVGVIIRPMSQCRCNVCLPPPRRVCSRVGGDGRG